MADLLCLHKEDDQVVDDRTSKTSADIVLNPALVGNEGTEGGGDMRPASGQLWPRGVID